MERASCDSGSLAFYLSVVNPMLVKIDGVELKRMSGDLIPHLYYFGSGVDLIKDDVDGFFGLHPDKAFNSEGKIVSRFGDFYRGRDLYLPRGVVVDKDLELAMDYFYKFDE